MEINIDMKTLKDLRGSRTIVFTFGRMNPPTQGHEKLIKKVIEVAKKEKGEARVYITHTQDAKKNPLTHKQKLKFLKLGVPESEDVLKEDQAIRTIWDAIKQMQMEGYTDLIFVVGDDRVKSFKELILPWIRHKDKTKSIEVDSFKVLSAGHRDPDSDEIDGATASKMREAARGGELKSFLKLCPSNLSNKFSKEMYDLVREGMKVADTVKLKNSKGIPRNMMPQIRKEDIKEFIKDLEKNGIAISKKELKAADLKPTQHEVNGSKIAIKKSNDKGQTKPYIVSIDNFILDGHHEWLSLPKNKKVVAYVVGLSIEDLLQAAKDFPKVYYKEIDE